MTDPVTLRRLDSSLRARLCRSTFRPFRFASRRLHTISNRMSTILVVDDHTETRKPLLRLLQIEGYKVIGAANALEALAAANHSDPDLILLDVMLPPMD